MIEISQLTFRYPRSDFALKVDRLEIARREKIAIIGPSGSGKTTLLNLFCGIVPPNSGTISIDNTTLSQLNDESRRNYRIANFGLVFQNFELVEYLNATNNILLPFLINQSLKIDAGVRQRVTSLANSMGLANKLNRRPRQLSQGEQQRVAICRALITQPKTILADEPTGNLDPKNKRKIIDLLFQQSETNNQTLVVVTHDTSLLNGFDRVIDFEDFRVDDRTPESATGANG